MKLKLILITVLAFASAGLAHAQGFTSNLSIGGGFEGVFPAATFDHNKTAPYLSTTQSSTKSVGYTGNLRYDFGRHSALEASVSFNRASELFFNGNGEFVSRVQTNNLEVIGAYIVRLPSTQKLKPYALVGGGIVHFSPNNDFTTGQTPASSGKPAIAYGFGTDFKMGDSWAIRLQYRGLIRTSPDFGLLSYSTSTGSNFGTGLKTHVPEPSIQLVYHF